MANEQNLVPITSRTPEERAEIGRKGGINSGKSKKKARNMREAARILLEAPLHDDPEMAAALEILGLEPDQQGAILAAAARRAKVGDIEAARFVRDTSGQSPAQALELSGPGGGPIESLDLGSLSNEQLAELLSRTSEDDG